MGRGEVACQPRTACSDDTFQLAGTTSARNIYERSDVRRRSTTEADSQ